jgi:hypothetical protein
VNSISVRLCAGAALAALGACATTPPPAAELAAARAAVSHAHGSASRHAPDQLVAAQAKLARAEAAMAQREYAEALRLAEQAEADAKLAQAMADSHRMRTALAEVNEGIAALKRQIEGRTP